MNALLDPESYVGSSRISRLHEFDRGVCEELVVTHRPRLLAVARRILRCEEEASDAVQDAFLSAFTSLHRFEARSQLYTWLHRIVVNACLMKLRARKRRRVVSLNALFPQVANQEPGSRSMPVDTSVSSFDRDELKAHVHACIEKLPEDYRTILLLRDIQEFDTDTTAGLLGISVGAVKTRLHRARRALRTVMEHESVEIAEQFVSCV